MTKKTTARPEMADNSDPKETPVTPDPLPTPSEPVVESAPVSVQAPAEIPSEPVPDVVQIPDPVIKPSPNDEPGQQYINYTIGGSIRKDN